MKSPRRIIPPPAEALMHAKPLSGGGSRILIPPYRSTTRYTTKRITTMNELLQFILSSGEQFRRYNFPNPHPPSPIPRPAYPHKRSLLTPLPPSQSAPPLPLLRLLPPTHLQPRRLHRKPHRLDHRAQPRRQRRPNPRARQQRRHALPAHRRVPSPSPDD